MSDRHIRQPRCCRPEPELDAWLARLSENSGLSVNQLLCMGLELLRAQATGRAANDPGPELAALDATHESIRRAIRDYHKTHAIDHGSRDDG